MKRNFTEIEIPFGAKDSELYQFTYTIPDGYSAEIKDGKVIVKKKKEESEDERIRKTLLRCCDDWKKGQFGCMAKEDVPAIRAYLEKQKDILGERAQNITANMLEDGIEGIQRELIEFLSNTVNASWVDIIRSADAYAERIRNIIGKQKEHKPLMSDGEIEDTKRDIVAAIRKYYSADYAEYLTSFLKRLSPEDNSEDEYGQKMLGIAYKLMYEHIPENLRTQEFWDSLKFMREYTGKVAIIHSYEQKPAEQLSGTFTSYDMAKTFTEGQNYVIAHPEKFGLCKPAEWSEEDEQTINMAIKTLENENYLTLAKRLRTLRPDSYKNCNSRWKPSETESLKDLPKWKKASAGTKLPSESVIRRDGEDPRFGSVAVYDCEYITVNELEKLPKED